MDFVKSYFGKNEPLPVEHFFLDQSTGKGSFLSKFFLQNPYFRTLLKDWKASTIFETYPWTLWVFRALK